MKSLIEYKKVCEIKIFTNCPTYQFLTFIENGHLGVNIIYLNVNNESIYICSLALPFAVTNHKLVII